MGFFILGNPKQRQVSTTRNLMDTDCFHKVNLMDTALFLSRKPDEYVHARHSKNEICECIFTLISYACRSPANYLAQPNSPSELAPMHVQPLTVQDLLLVAQALDDSCIYTDKFRYFSKNGFSYEYHYDLINWLLYISKC